MNPFRTTNSRNTRVFWLRELKKTIRVLLSNRFALASDGWSDGDTHFVAMFSCAPAENDILYKTYLLGVSPFEEELSQDALHHKSYSEFVLDLFEKSYENVVALLAYNCSTNRSVAEKIQKPLIGSPKLWLRRYAVSWRNWQIRFQQQSWKSTHICVPSVIMPPGGRQQQLYCTGFKESKNL